MDECVTRTGFFAKNAKVIMRLLATVILVVGTAWVVTGLMHHRLTWSDVAVPLGSAAFVGAVVWFRKGGGMAFLLRTRPEDLENDSGRDSDR